MNSEYFSEAMNELDSKYIDEANLYQKSAAKCGRVPKTARIVFAACLALAVLGGVFAVTRRLNRIPLSDNSVNVTARYVKRAPMVARSDSLIFLTEEELFTYFDTAVFKGTILEINNIALDFNGDITYRALAKINVERVYRGPCSAGDTISVLLPCPIGTNILIEDSGIASAMREGTTGIFMPMIYNETSIWQQNGATLALKDLANYGFADGVRYAFLETENGLKFARDVYESIADVTTLDEIEAYIQNMLGR